MFKWILRKRLNRLEQKLASLTEQLSSYEELRVNGHAKWVGDIDYFYRIPEQRAQLAAYKTKYYQLKENK